MRIVRLLLGMLLILLLLVGKGETTDWCNDSDTQGCWLMDYDENPIRDDSQNTNTGSVSTPTFVASCITDGCYDFNGTTDRIIVTKDSSLEPQALTITSKVIFDGNSGYQAIFSKDNTAQVDPYYSYRLIWGGGNLSLQIVSSSYGTKSVNSYSWTPTVGVEYALSATYDDSSGDGKRNKLYIDGSEVSTENTSVTIAYHATDHYIGYAKNTSNPFNGKIDELSFSDIARDGTDINEIMNFGLQPATPSTTPTVTTLNNWIIGGNATFN